MTRITDIDDDVKTLVYYFHMIVHNLYLLMKLKGRKINKIYVKL